ncbi:MAG: hypothetical protein H0U76_27555 [Ktedonobacteraceae bacterium]|nr:hypothetical protein [Ktedonobacteraceae bacterium]
MSTTELLLRALQSTTIADSDRVEVLADLQLEGRKDALLEQIVARLSLEKSISTVRWEVVSNEEAAGMVLFGSKQGALDESEV